MAERWNEIASFGTQIHSTHNSNERAAAATHPDFSVNTTQGSRQASSRYCTDCGRALKACLCAHLPRIDNPTALLVLQHPNEATHPKGTAHLLTGSLRRAELRVGDDWERDSALMAALTAAPHYLLWPDETAQPLSALPAEPAARFVLLDGTWRKCYRMLMENPTLAALPRVAIAPRRGHYQIRKAPFDGALSTLEAGYHLLCEWEGESARYAPLWRLFERFNAQWLAFSQAKRGE
ncbi:tRNA-uridine aminocarboxypropyltransferase [Aeromonas simiae]|uniref:tRNA-uridine aminocarboxypropyltransferase n=1 Tax=Aeromonas simiae TaxID=218936 RepID=UPI0038D15050